MSKYRLLCEIPLTDGHVIRNYLAYNADSVKSIWKLHIESSGEEVLHSVEHENLTSVLIDYICRKTFNKRFEPAIRKLLGLKNPENKI
jgi:hypothetical protein